MFKYLTSLTLAAVCLSAADNLPRIDLHVHLDAEAKGGKSVTPSEAAALSKKLGVRFGVLAEGGCGGEIRDDKTLEAFLQSMEGQPMWRGLQVYGFGWPNCLSAEKLGKLDYIAADALVFPDSSGPHASGRSVWLWLPGVTFADPQDFMDRYVEFNLRVLAQPIQVWANPTYIPESLKARYDELWTPARMDRLIAAAVKNHVAIEINAHFQIPSAAFVRRAKAAGAKFSIGSNRHAQGIGEIEYCLRMARNCGLTAKDFFVPSRNLGK
jgi:hypothetical protein